MFLNLLQISTYKDLLNLIKMIWLSLLLTLSFSGVTFVVIHYLLKRRYKKSLFSFIKISIKKFHGKHIKIKKFLAISALLLLIGTIVFGWYNLTNRLLYFRNISGSVEWRSSNGQDYLYVEAGDAYSLGYLTGREASFKIAMMKEFLLGSSLLLGMNYFDLIEMAEKYAKFIPNDYLEEIRGISEGSTAGSGFYISFEDILVQAVFFEIIYGQLDPKTENFAACTAFGAIDKDNKSIIGQNIDLAKPMVPYGYFVLHKLNNNPKVFTYRLGGCPGFPMGKNELGLTIVMNLVKTKEKASLITPLFVKIREGLAKEEKAANLYERIFPKNQSPYGLNFLFADKYSIVAIQALPSAQNVSVVDSMKVHSNTYLIEEWRDKLYDSDYSNERQEYAEEILKETYEKNELNNRKLLDLLSDKPIICRDEDGILGIKTSAFITGKYFGCGTTNDAIGTIPL